VYFVGLHEEYEYLDYLFDKINKINIIKGIIENYSVYTSVIWSGIEN
jgi:hypothetical protein